MASPLSDIPAAEKFVSNVSTGLKVLGSELKLLVSDACSTHEAKQMRKRMEEQYAQLGALARKHLEQENSDALDPKGEAGIILTQIQFLEQEIEKMGEDKIADREKELAERARTLGGDK